MKAITSKIFILAILVWASTDATAQRRMAAIGTVITVVDPQQKAVEGALVTASEGALVVKSDKYGRASITVPHGSAILVEASGYEPATGTATQGEMKFTLVRSPYFAGSGDDYTLPMLQTEKRRYLVGAVSAVDGEDLVRYTGASLSNALQGRLLGLYSQMNAGGDASLFIRGHHRDSDNGIVAIVDGVERSIYDLIPEEIERVEVLKDATSKITYGARAANGILLITTKHGKPNTRTIRISAETGLGLAMRVPKYLGSYDYASLYNEARANDGLAPLYTSSDLAGYRNTSGPNDLRYPDVDYYDYFLRNHSGYSKATLEFLGGTEQTRYAMVAGYTGTRGMQSVGTNPSGDRFNIRGNLDVKVTDRVELFMGMAGVFDENRSGVWNQSQVFSALSSHRPNEYPLVISDGYLPADSTGIPKLGASMAVKDNLYGMLLYGGKRKDQEINGKLNLGLRFDLCAITEGLSAKGCITFDNYFYGRESLEIDLATYAQRWIPNSAGTGDSVVFIQHRNTNMTDQQKLSDSYNLRSNAFIGSVDYHRLFNGIHRVNASLNYYMMKIEATGSSQDTKTANTSLKGNYTYRDRLIFEGSTALMQSGKFKGSNRNFMAFAGGAGWVVSEEGFMKEIEAVDFLKLKASAGLLGYDVAAPWFSYDNRWYDNGTARINNSLNPNKVTYEQMGNSNLHWEKSFEMNMGVEALMLGRKLWAEVNYFNELRYDMIQKVDANYSSAYGGLYPYTNWGKVRNQGIEAEVKWSDNAGAFFYEVAGRGVWSANKVLVANQLAYPDTYRSQRGSSSSAIYGYVSEGLFGRDVSLDGHVHQTLGAYGVGDIAYRDLNGDGRVDDLDRRQIGYSFPRAQFGLEVSLFYKGFGLYLLGTAQLGGDAMLNNSYYWNYGEGKYSDVALDRYHPVNNPTGTYPRLTTTEGTNNFVNSDYWVESTDFFRLKNAELSYTFGYDKPLPVVKKIKVYARGSNLFVLSKIDRLDPEAMNAGVTNIPVLRLITGGVTLTF